MRARFIERYCFAALAAFCATNAVAEEQDAPMGMEAETKDDPSKWDVSISPYVWFASLNGKVATFPALRPVEVDASFGDIFDHLDFAAMAILQARKGRFVTLVDVAYLDLSIDKGIDVLDRPLTARLDTSTFTGTAVAGYRALDRGETFIDFMGGLRLSNADARISLGGPVRTISSANSETWVDAVGAVRMRASLGQRWAVVTYADVGAGSSELTWQLQAALQYRLGNKWWLSAGWRQYGVDYRQDDFLYDVSLGGPIIGVTYSF